MATEHIQQLVSDLQTGLRETLEAKTGFGRRTFIRLTGSVSEDNIVAVENFLKAIEPGAADLKSNWGSQKMLERVLELRNTLKANESTTFLSALDRILENYQDDPVIAQILLGQGVDLTFSNYALQTLESELSVESLNEEVKTKQYVIPKDPEVQTDFLRKAALDLGRNINNAGYSLGGVQAKQLAGFKAVDTVEEEQKQTVVDVVAERLDKTHPGLKYFLSQDTPERSGIFNFYPPMIAQAFSEDNLIPSMRLSFDIGEREPDGSFIITETCTIDGYHDMLDLENPEQKIPIHDPVVVTVKTKANYSPEGDALAFEVARADVNLGSEMELQQKIAEKQKEYAEKYQEQYIIPTSDEAIAEHMHKANADTQRRIQGSLKSINGKPVKVIAGYMEDSTIPESEIPTAVGKVFNALDQTHPGLKYFMSQGRQGVPGMQFQLSPVIDDALGWLNQGRLPQQNYEFSIGENINGSFLITEKYTVYAYMDPTLASEDRTVKLEEPITVEHAFRGTYSDNGNALNFKTESLNVQILKRADQTAEPAEPATKPTTPTLS